MKVRAKFVLDEVSENRHNSGNKKFKFQAICNDNTPENEAFYKYTPSGSLELTCNNPAVIEEFKLGKEYYLDFTPTDEA